MTPPLLGGLGRQNEHEAYMLRQERSQQPLDTPVREPSVLGRAWLPHSDATAGEPETPDIRPR